MTRAQRFDVSDPEQVEAGIDAASLAIRRGKLVVFPTDTVYGIAADAFDSDAVARLLAAKGRGRHMPPPVLVGASATIDALATDLPAYVRPLIDAFWPGGLTLVCREQVSLQWDLGDTRGTVAVRMPDNEVVRSLLERTGPLAVSSANLTGQPAATDGDEAQEQLGDRVDVILDGGPTSSSTPSTILNVMGERPKLLRAGAISVEQIDAVLEDLGVSVEIDSETGED